MRVEVRAPYRTRVRQALADEGLRDALDRATSHLSERRERAMAAVDSEAVRDQARAARDYAIDHLPDLLEELERNLLGNGCQVHWARDAAEALGAVLDIAQQHEVRDVVKSKSMVTEEIGLNDAFERSGIDVVETDAETALSRRGGRWRDPRIDNFVTVLGILGIYKLWFKAEGVSRLIKFFFASSKKAY